MKTIISSIQLGDHKADKQNAREQLALHYDATERLARNSDLLTILKSTSVRELNKKIMEGGHLSYEEAFCGMCYVVAATNSHVFTEIKDVLSEAYGVPFSRDNALIIGTAFLKLMADKETYDCLTPEEVAGMACAAKMDTVFELDINRVIETCGMGGDKGFASNGIVQKTINGSTLSAIVLASMGYTTAKHGSYGNTSAIGSTEAIELLGVKTNIQSIECMNELLAKTNFCYLDAHLSKTIHDLSHLLMMETINHIIGPMSPPFSRDTQINKVMGVNEKIHPEVIAKAYALLHQKGVQKNGGIAIICGLDMSGMFIDYNDHAQVKQHCILDEMSPYASVVSLTYEDTFLGNFMVTSDDFGISIAESDIYVGNDRKLAHSANISAITGLNHNLANYLAMSVAMGIFVYEGGEAGTMVQDGHLNFSLLKDCFMRARNAIDQGGATILIEAYASMSSQNNKEN